MTWKTGCISVGAVGVATIVGGIAFLIWLGDFLPDTPPSKPRVEMPAFVGPPTPKRLLPQRDTTSKPRPEAKEPRKPVFTDAERKQAVKEMKQLEAAEDRGRAALASMNRKLAATGIFLRIGGEGTGRPVVWTGRDFDDLSIDQKNTALGLVWDALPFRIPIEIKDGRTGKTLGEYRPGRGLKMK